jgi:glyoxylase-like metal-dependent hydrolase (beta-lactamase superfamily II)
MRKECFVCGPLANNAYLLWDGGTGRGVLIDAPFGSFATCGEFLKKNSIRLDALLLTHGHWDHMAEAATFQREFSLAVYAGEGDGVYFDRPELMATYLPPGMGISPCHPDRPLVDGNRLQLLGEDWLVRAVAGHTPGGLVFVLPSQGWAFCGDSIFRGTVGRSDLPGGDGKLLIQQLRGRVLSLGDSTQLFPGHGESTTVGRERVSNPHLR